MKRIAWNKGMNKENTKLYKEYSENMRLGTYKLCLECGKEFYCKKYRIKIGKFCSRKCHYQNIERNLKNSEAKKLWWSKQENKNKINSWWKLNKDKIDFSNSKKAIKNLWKTRKWRNKMSKVISKRNKKYGAQGCSLKSKNGLTKLENHPNWLGGKSFEPYGLEFNNKLKEKIRIRDKNTCQICNKNGNRVHHIDYIKQNNNELNLINLCTPCHMKTNYNRIYWTWQLQIFMNLWNNANNKIEWKNI